MIAWRALKEQIVYNTRLFMCLDGLVEQQWLPDIADFRNGALQIKSFGEHNLEDLQTKRVRHDTTQKGQRAQGTSIPFER